MTIKIYNELKQGTDEWLQARCGLLTASNAKLLLTPTLKIANNDKTRAYLYELLAQRITNFVEPIFQTFDMERGHIDEIYARRAYSKHYAEAYEVGFITNDKWGFKLGYSPDGLVGDKGLIEIKSRKQKFQVETIINFDVPSEYILQLQTGLLVSEREWIDFISYSAGLPMFVYRVTPDQKIQDVIIEAVGSFEEQLKELRSEYDENEQDFIKTERINEDVIYLEGEEEHEAF